MKFAISEMTALKYFLPLVVEGNKRGLRSTLILFRSNKYNCPFLKEHLEQLKLFSEIYNFTLCESGQDDKTKDVVFYIEGALRDKPICKSKSISLCYSTDFSAGYEKYIDEVDYVVFSSKHLSNYYNKHSEKNLYLGSPKFDCHLNSNDIIKKYSLDESKRKATIFYPRTRDIHSCPLQKISTHLKDAGFEIIIKSRMKDAIQENHLSLADKCLYDISWFPHTSLELIKVSDLIINFSSTVIEETTALKKPVINFHIKPFAKPLAFLYDYSFVKNLTVDFSKSEFQSSIDDLCADKNLEDQFAAAKQSLFDTKNSSKDIINFVLNL